MKYKDLNIGEFFSYLGDAVGVAEGLKRPDTLSAMKTHKVEIVSKWGNFFSNAVGLDGEFYQMDAQDLVRREYPHFEP